MGVYFPHSYEVGAKGSSNKPIHPRDHDLVIATHGRGIWIIDDM